MHALPFIMPDENTMKEVETIVKKIIDKKKSDLIYDFVQEQKDLDEIIFNFYTEKFNFPQSLKEKLNQKYSIYRNE